MKMSFALAAIFTGIVLAGTGCSDKAQIDKQNRKLSGLDSRADQLESRIAELERKSSIFIDGFTNLMDHLQQMQQSNLVTQAAVVEQMARQDEVMEAVKVWLAAQVTNRPPLVYKFATTEPIHKPWITSQPAKNGVPAAIYNQIAADAASEWPGNYEMQEYRIKNEIESYLKLHSAK